VEIYGREAAGKTTLALQIIKEAQKLGGTYQYFSFLDLLRVSNKFSISNLILSEKNSLLMEISV